MSKTGWYYKGQYLTNDVAKDLTALRFPIERKIEGERKMTKETGGPAFPARMESDTEVNCYSGMFMRDYFAGMALQGLLASRPLEGGSPERMAENASCLSYLIADEMLKARGS